MAKAMTKAVKERLENYLTCNYTRRAVLLARWGYASQEEYFTEIGYTPKYTRKPKGAPVSVAKTVGKIPGSKAAPRGKSVGASVEPPVDMVIAFDTTGSMGAFIDNVKDHAVKVVEDLFKNSTDLKMKIVAFGDYCDMETPDKFGRAYQEIELTDDTNKLVKFIKNARDTGGGDSDEFYELVIRKINTETKWRENSKKVVLFIADCDPHPKSYKYGYYVKEQIDWREEAKAAAELGIAYDTLSIHGDKYPWYKELAKITGGAYMPFSSSNKTSKLMEASTFARSSKKAFEKGMSDAEKSGDKELIGVYKSLSTLK